MEKNEILKKIEVLFFKKTYGDVSLQDISQELGIKKSSLYYYFNSKEELFQELLEYSFINYSNFLIKILKLDFDLFINKFIYYPLKTKNLFSIINQKGYCENNLFNNYIKEKQKQIFKLISTEFAIRYWFKNEKTFLLLSILDDIGRKKCIFGDCLFDMDIVLNEIQLLFKK